MRPRVLKLLLLAAVAGSVLLAGCGTQRGTGLVSAVTAATHHPSPIPAGTRHRLLVIAERLAKSDGDPNPQWISVVASTREKAVRASSGDLVGGPDFPAYLITMKGRFADPYWSGPSGSKEPTGHYVTLVVNARTLQGTDYGISPGPPPEPASVLGPVTYLKGP
jgi:hypothetical protein